MNKNNVENIYELTPVQEGMLFHTLYTPGSKVYFQQFSYSLKGNLNIEAFKNAWKQVIGRHTILRTSFHWKDLNKPVQIIHKNVEIPWEVQDWSNLSSEDQQRKLEKFLKDDQDKGFELDKAPVMRFNIFKFSENIYQFTWSHHHLLIDGWSLPIVVKEVFDTYDALVKNLSLNLPHPRPFKDFISWMKQQDRSIAEKYWKEELKGFASTTPLVVDRNINKNESKAENYEEVNIEISREVIAKLQSILKQHKLTMNTLIQGIWAIILNRYSNESDILYGATVSGRSASLKGIEAMVGMFINTLPVRVKLFEDKNLIGWLKELQNKHIERDQFAYSSLVDIQGWSEIPRGDPLFESILVFENYPIDKSLQEGIGELFINDVKIFVQTNYTLTIMVVPAEKFSIHISYDTSRFEKDVIQRLFGHIQTLMKEISENPEREISDYNILSDSERNRILLEWNDTQKYFPKEKCVHHLFEEQAEKTPDAIAVELDNRKLPYKKLNEKANQVANYLVKLGVGPDVMVGICIERSFEMIIGLLGILKAGGACVPLDSSYPLERLAFMIEDSEIPILLTNKNFLDKLPKTKAKTILLDEDAEIIFKESVNYPVEIHHFVERKVNSSNLAYVIFTSGSTGKPKGVLMRHKALTNLLYWQLEGQKFGRGYRTLQFTTLSFDVAFQEIFSTWYSGGTLVMMKEEDRQDLSKVLRIIKERKIQRLFLPFIALQELAETFTSSKEKTLDLKEVITAGEQLQNTPAIINLFNNLNDFIFTNQYGPSESHVVASYTLNNEPNNWIKLPPIGKPVFNTQIYILDSSLKPVPIGVTGDLYIGGVGLVRGYHNRPELTKERFIDNPINKDLSEKLYKTGDLARYLCDGNIEFIGRADNQIKLRGFRIELGEIENVLSLYKGLKNVVVVAKEFNGGDKKLVAYIVANQEPAPQISELRKYLKSKLPEYMVPFDFVMLKELPLTPTGKVNQRALPEPESIRVNESNNYVEPKDTLELQLVKIWEKVLGVKPIGIKDNFFELGGHSLLALRVFSYIEKLTGRKLALSTLFNSPTIEQLAAILKDEGWTPSWKSLVAVKPGGSKLPFYCVPPAAGTALHFQDLIKYLPKDQPFYVLESVGLDGKEPPHTKLEEMAAHYVKEIQTLQPEGPYLLGGRCFGGRVVFEMAQQLMKQDQKVGLLAIFDTWPPFIAPPISYVRPERNLKYFIDRSLHHLKTGELWKVSYKYTSNELRKLKWKVKNKLEYVFSNEKKKLYKQIMLIHFNAQDRYVAKKYSGRITLIECATFKLEYREGWMNLAEGGFEYYIVPNTNHKTIVKEPKLEEFAMKLNFVLEKTHKELQEKPKINGTVSSTIQNDRLEKIEA